MLERRYRLSDGVRLQHPDGSDMFLAYRTSDGACYKVNEVAFEVLARLDGTRPVEEIATGIHAEFAGADTALGDIAAFLEALENEGLVVKVSE